MVRFYGAEPIGQKATSRAVTIQVADENRPDFFSLKFNFPVGLPPQPSEQVVKDHCAEENAVESQLFCEAFSRFNQQHADSLSAILRPYK